MTSPQANKIFEYPKCIVAIGAEPYFRRAVLHGLCFRDNTSERKSDAHAYSLGYWIGMMTMQYVRVRKIHPLEDNISVQQLVLNEVNRIDKL